MCRSMVDIQSATAEIRGGKEEKMNERKKQDKNIMSASATHGGHNHAKATFSKNCNSCFQVCSTQCNVYLCRVMLLSKWCKVTSLQPRVRTTKSQLENGNFLRAGRCHRRNHLIKFCINRFRDFEVLHPPITTA